MGSGERLGSFGPAVNEGSMRAGSEWMLRGAQLNQSIMRIGAMQHYFFSTVITIPNVMQFVRCTLLFIEPELLHGHCA